MVFSQLDPYFKLRDFIVDQAWNREREGYNNGEKEGMLAYLKRKQANAKLLADERRRKRECNRDGGEGGALIPVNKERKLAHGSSPQSSGALIPPITIDRRYQLNFDLWTDVAKHMGGKEMAIIGSVSQWFKYLISQGFLWERAFLRDMKIPVPCPVIFDWKEIYDSAFNGSHSFSFRLQDKHTHIGFLFVLKNTIYIFHNKTLIILTILIKIHVCNSSSACKRFGAFYLNSNLVLLTHTLHIPSELPPIGIWLQSSVELFSMCSLNNARTGIWISDHHVVHCQWCSSSRGLVHVLDARHLELFLEEGFKNGTWQYQDIGIRIIPCECDTAFAGIFDLSCMGSPNTSRILNLNSWGGPSTQILGPNMCDGPFTPHLLKSVICSHAVALMAHLEHNIGIFIRYQVMKNDNQEVVAIRISQYVI
ncbi:hypothetical protein LUZ62_045854 [Rhynchospora pubera]|uniref:Uncharacterized protein n=1 Tax=Rhynchospora pubera TaxID=906938 RepID=A0AAV8FMZ9_9POAL|nr:hypothetical protein LUZ62_045854 [Rhynchospora pubera]